METTTPQQWTQRAFAPAHITGFFEIHDQHTNPYRKGSRGAGLNLHDGVTATVTISQEHTQRRVRINNRPDDAPVVHAALDGLLGHDYPAGIDIELDSPLPGGQGFGLSGAGALATGTALSRLIGFPQKNAVWEAHKAEIMHHTGLGDVPAQALGGAEIRITPGPMPMGVLERFAGREARFHEVVCCILQQPLSTRSVLEDPAARERINRAGAESVDRLRTNPTLAHYMQLAHEFAERAQLGNPALDKALATARQYAPATQTMLGNALHALIDTRDDATDAVGLVDELSQHGTVWQTRISSRGAHALDDPAARKPL